MKAKQFEPVNEISNNVLCATSKASDQPVKLLTEPPLEFLSLKGGCRGSSESTLVKMSNCLKSYAATHLNVSSATKLWCCC